MFGDEQHWFCTIEKKVWIIAAQKAIQMYRTNQTGEQGLLPLMKVRKTLFVHHSKIKKSVKSTGNGSCF